METQGIIPGKLYKNGKECEGVEVYAMGPHTFDRIWYLHSRGSNCDFSHSDSGYHFEPMRVVVYSDTLKSRTKGDLLFDGENLFVIRTKSGEEHSFSHRQFKFKELEKDSPIVEMPNGKKYDWDKLEERLDGLEEAKWR